MKKIVSILIVVALIWVSGLHQVIAGFVRTNASGVADGSCGFGFGYDSNSGYGYGYGSACATPYYVMGGGAFTPYATPGSASTSSPTSTNYNNGILFPTVNGQAAVTVKKPIDGVLLDGFLLKNKAVRPVHLYTSKNKCYGEIVGKFDIVGNQNAATINLSQNGKTKYQFFPSIQKNGSYSVALQQGKWSVKPGTYQMTWTTKTFLGSVDAGTTKVTITNRCKKVMKKKILPMTGVAFIQ